MKGITFNAAMSACEKCEQSQQGCPMSAGTGYPACAHQVIFIPISLSRIAHQNTHGLNCPASLSVRNKLPATTSQQQPSVSRPLHSETALMKFQDVCHGLHLFAARRCLCTISLHGSGWPQWIACLPTVPRSAPAEGYQEASLKT